MYEGKEKTYYKGFAKSTNEFIVAAFVTELTASDEMPYLTAQLTLNIENGWSSIIYEDDFITDFTDYLGDVVLAVSRDGNIFNASNGTFQNRVGENIFSHIHGIANSEGKVFICGDNGNFFEGSLNQLELVKSEYLTPIPDGTSLDETIAWAQKSKLFNSVVSTREAFVVSGSHGLMLNFTDSGIKETIINPEIRITNQYYNHVDSTVWFCGHTPAAVIGKWRGTEDYEIVFSSQDNEQLVSIAEFQGQILVADISHQGGVFYLENGALREAEFTDIGKFGLARQVQAKDGILWALFERALIRYDGQTWDVFRHPDHL